MIRRNLLTSLVLSVLAGALQAQEADRLELRVSSVGLDSTVNVDRGRRDRLATGDLVLFFPREGGTHRGVVIRLQERSAVVDLHDKTIILLPGTRGEVLIPRSRAVAERTEEKKEEKQEEKKEEKTEEKKDDETKTEEEKRVGAGDPVFRNQDEGFRQGQPLLAGMRPVRPEDRETQTSGRLYAIGSLIDTGEDGLSHSFGRVGADVLYENPFGRGGGLILNGEFNFKTEENENEGGDLLVRGLSYYWGGTRFSKTRWEVGRFLQHGMRELQYLDGVEWSGRRDNRHRYGASIGFMPELDDDFDTGQDLQLAAYYDWVFGDREELTITSAYQKSFHNGKVDRDLLIAKMVYLPMEGWDFRSTFWVDYYYGKDDIKGKGFELTQAVVSTGRRWENGNGVDLTYRRQRIPEIQRNEFRPVLANQIADNRYDRLTFTGWAWMSEDVRFHSHVAGWDDEEHQSGAADFGFDVSDLLLDRSNTDLTIFATAGQFSTSGGARLSVGQFTDDGRWNALYELVYHHHIGFLNDRDDILQHRVRFSRDYHSIAGWDLSLHTEASLWDDELSWAAGFYFQRTF